MIDTAQLLSNAEMEGIRMVAPTFLTRPTDDKRTRWIARFEKRFPTCFNISALAVCGLTIVSSAYAACNPSSSWLSPVALSDYAEQPETILNNSASTSREAQRLSALISEYAATGPAAIETIRSVLPDATPQQRTAIGNGLFAAVAFCRVIDSTSSARIERSIKSLNDKEVMLAYERAEASSAPSTANFQSNLMIGVTPVKKAAHGPDLLGKPPLTGPWELKLNDPIGRPGE
jgi:hypothetical protein